GTILVARARADRSTECGEPETRDAIHVSNRSVDDDAAELLGGCRVTHQFSEYRGGHAATRIHDHDITGLRDLKRLVHHQVVAWPAEHRHGDSTQRNLAARLNSWFHEIEPTHRVGEIRRGHSAKSLDERLR